MKKKDNHISSEFKKTAFLNWLDEAGLSYTVNDDLCIVDGEYGQWIVNLLLETRGKPTTMQTKLFNMIKTVDRTKADKFSILIEHSAPDTMTFKSISEYVREQLNISLITVNAKGKIKEYV
ncbi:hypothetical protein [[Clostridium] innocuum]|uniref:hypothetical protein n=1 Tax=Clostridium innocuum TaxID=1522 RepID=UPI001AF60FBA|nr:hypothetical protein [[Clostridium] innocuum]MDU1018764.1 hypothetical protein [Bifidobacterium breve]QSI26861.1 hypothetical protein GKZ87_15905 [Erysipelotrichaceae bacterium 66202529]MCC2831827.1 hypothetical protein [[Clostridium] innocuum]MCR0248543.1 hypothetical protein [[Clostridium] innocuum]MCR0261054.1 hypothetical protein [[Clostridium] innocuum]